MFGLSLLSGFVIGLILGIVLAFGYSAYKLSKMRDAAVGFAVDVGKEALKNAPSTDEVLASLNARKSAIFKTNKDKKE